MSQEIEAQNEDVGAVAVEDAEEERRKRRRGLWPWIALIILILIILWLIWQYLGGIESGRRGLTGVTTTTEVQAPATIPPEPAAAPAAPSPLPPSVPDVIGMTKGEAVSALSSAGYKPLVSEFFGTTRPANIVFKQNPSAGSMLKSGGTVVIQVEERRPSVPVYSMPNLAGKTKAAALSRLAGMGVKVTFSYAPVSGQKKAGTVCSQWPLAGDSVARGGDVQIQLFVNP